MPTPPTLRELLSDPIYRRMMTTMPRVASCQLTDGARPWTLYVATEAPERPTGVSWRRGRYPTYADAYSALRRQLSVPGVADVALSSNSVEYAPPPGFNWRSHAEWAGTEWCARCRRPSFFRAQFGKHALTSAAVLRSDNPKRCYFCGMAIDGMFRMYNPIPLPTPAKKAS